VTEGEDQVLRLADGRALGYRDWGPTAGRPVVFFHGAPGSRLFCPDAGVARDLGLRLITFDRPGFGRSDPNEGRDIVGTVPDVAALVDHLGFGRFALAGVSAGGPHTLACASALGDRVTGVAVASMPGPLDEVPGAWVRLGDQMRPTAEMARAEPFRSRRAVVRYMQAWVDDPSTYLRPGGPPADRAVKADPRFRPMLLADVAEALRGGAVGQADDLIAFWRPWGFSVAEAPAGVRLFHGAQDSRSRADFDHLIAALPAARPTVWLDQGHYGIVPHWHQVLASILE
jgi:pimeloyl-ACP methyl ester carboxylesterase